MNLVSIIILTHNQIQYTKQCLESLFACTSQIKSPYEVIVVDNASADETPQYLQELEGKGQISLILNKENFGFPKGNNQAAAIAKGEYLCLLNNDTILTPGWLEKLLRCIRTDSQIAAVGPYTSHSSGYQQVQPQPNYRGNAELAAYAQRFSAEEKYVDFLVFFCCLIKRKVWDQIGGLDEDFGQGNFEDNLFCYRILENEYRMKIAGDAYIHHYSGKTFQREDPVKLRHYASLLARNQKIFGQKTKQYRTISLCMIVSDKEQPETLARCIESAYEWVDEICIVFNYARWKNFRALHKLQEVVVQKINSYNVSHKSKLMGFFQYLHWTDFADMRNKSFDMATSEYILWLDTDDALKTPAGMRDLILKNAHIDAFKFKVLSYTEIGTIETVFHNRLLRNKKEYRFVNRCHEDISYALNEYKAQHAMTDMIVEHYGYMDRKAWYLKNKRNYELMQKDINEILFEQKFKNPRARENSRDKVLPEDLGDQNSNGRLSMLYYGIVNSMIILYSTMRSKQKYAACVQAMNICDKCISLLLPTDPLMVKMWTLRGIVCMDADQHLPAKQSFHKAYDEYKNPEAAVNLAELYLREKNYNKAIEILSPIYEQKGAYPLKSLSFDPVLIQALVLEKLGHAYAAKSQVEPADFDAHIRKAEALYRESLSFRPKLEIAHVLLQILRNSKRHDEAGYFAIKTVNKWPGYFMGWQFLAEYEMLNKRYHTARVFFQEALRLKPTLKEARHNLDMLRRQK